MKRGRTIGLVATVVVTVGGVADTTAATTAPAADATVVVVDDSGQLAVSVPAGWVDSDTSARDFGDGSSPSVMVSPDNETLVNTFDVPGVLVTVRTTPADHDELMAAFGLTEGCTTFVTEDFADATLTGIIQKGDGCGDHGAVWRTIIGDTASGQTVVAQGQAPDALGLPELNAALGSVVVAAPDAKGAAPHASAGTTTPVTGLVDATASIALRVPAAWSDVAADPFDFDTGAAQPYLLAATNGQEFLETFDAPGLGVTIPNWDATHEELLTDFGLESGCTSIEVEPYADGTLTGLLQRGDDCGASGAVWRAIAGDTADGLTVVVFGQTPSYAGMSELEEAIGSIEIIAEFDPDAVVVGDTKPAPSMTVPTTSDTAPAETATDTATVDTATVDTATVDTADGSVPGGTGSIEEVLGAPPAGFVRLVDDTGTLTMVAPESWSWVDTYELDFDGGKPRIIATPDLGQFQGDGDVGGALLIAEPYEPDPASMVSDFRRDESCVDNGDQPYDDGSYVGWIWIGEQCGPAGTGTWAVIAASPPDQSVTLRLHLRVAAGEDEVGQQVLSTYSVLEPGTIAPATLPERIVPAGAVPANIAQAFLDAIRFGDGDGACSLLDPAATGNVGLSIRGCGQRITEWYPAAAAQDVVVVGEPTIDGECNASNSSDPAADSASVEFAVLAESGCISFERDPAGEWVIVDFSGSVLAGDS